MIQTKYPELRQQSPVLDPSIKVYEGNGVLQSIATLANAISLGRVRAVRAVEHSLEKIAQHNPDLNAVTALRATDAIREAAELDRRIQEGLAVGPLAGLPMLVKDLEDVEGLPTYQASLLRQNVAPATRDSRLTRVLRAAGGIVVGKSNLSEFGIEGHSDNRLFGATKNPWKRSISSGGSSGGSAAALAAGLSAVVTATDGGGSVRIPAALCGSVGMKPTNDLIHQDPLHDWPNLSTDAILVKRIADLRLVFSIMLGVAPRGETGAGANRSDARYPQRLLATLRTSSATPTLPPDVMAAFEAAADAIADVLHLQVKWLDNSDVFSNCEIDSDWTKIAGAEQVNILGRQVVVENMELLHPSSREFLTIGLEVDLDEYIGARRRRYQYRAKLDHLLGGDGVLITPTLGIASYLPDGRLDETDKPGLMPAHFFNTAIHNLTGHPAISVPAGYTMGGIPFGLQITAPRYADNALIEIASRWEKSHPWPLTAPRFTDFCEDLLEG